MVASSESSQGTASLTDMMSPLVNINKSIEKQINDTINTRDDGINDIKQNYYSNIVSQLSQNTLSKLEESQYAALKNDVTNYLNNPNITQEEKYSFLANMFQWDPTKITSTDTISQSLCTPSSTDAQAIGLVDIVIDWLKVPANLDITNVNNIDVVPSAVDSSCPSWNGLTASQQNNFITASQSVNSDITASQSISELNDQYTADLQTKINQIQDLDEARANILDTQPVLFKAQYNTAVIKQADLGDKAITAKIIQEENDNLDYNLGNVKAHGINKIRTAEINTYYAEKYRAQLGVVKLSVLFGIIFLLFAIIKKQGLIPEAISNVILAIIIVLSLYFVGGKIYDISRRDNMNFQEYDWSSYKPEKSGPDDPRDSVWETDKRAIGDFMDSSVVNSAEQWIDPTVCKGDACCPEGYAYGDEQNMCVPKSQVHNDKNVYDNY